jgi:hypothetical protein
MVLSAGGSFAYFARNAHCIVTTDLLLWYSNTQNEFSLGATIFSLHKLPSPNGRNVNYDGNKLTGEIFFWVVCFICTGFVNTFPTVFLQQMFVIPEYIMKHHVYKKCSVCLSFICRYSRVFYVVSSRHAADVPSVSDFVPNPMNHVRIWGPNRFCYPSRAKIVIMGGDFFWGGGWYLVLNFL